MSQTRIVIRPLRPDDAQDIYTLMHMPNVLWGTSLLPSSTIERWQKIIAGWLDDTQVHVFVAEIDKKVVGSINLTLGEGRARHVGDIAMAVHDAHQGQGVGRLLLLTIIDLADNWLNLLRLELHVYADNESAIHLYQTFDFEIEGRKRCAAFRGGVYIDSYMMGRLHPQTQSQPAAPSES